MTDSLRTHHRKGKEQGREQGTGNREAAHRTTQRHQATRSGVSACGYVDSRSSEPLAIADLVNAIAQQYIQPRISEERHEVIRTGERRQIPQPVRLAVLLRDAFRCAICGFSVRRSPAHLDHIRPWSAGGPDTTANLRATCPACNEGRSNRVDADETPRQPGTFWCDECVGAARYTGHDQGMWLFTPPAGHTCWFCQQPWWQALYVASAWRPDASPFAAIASPMHVPARCLHCRVDTASRWSL